MKAVSICLIPDCKVSDETLFPEDLIRLPPSGPGTKYGTSSVLVKPLSSGRTSQRQELLCERKKCFSPSQQPHINAGG